MKRLLFAALSWLWPRPLAVPPDLLVPPGRPHLDLGGGWRVECFALNVVNGVAWEDRRLVCPSRRKSWPWDRRGLLSLSDTLAMPN